MADQVVGQPQAQSLALAEPDQHVRVRWIGYLTLASLGMWMAVQTPSQVMLALQLQDITPRHKIAALGVVTAVNAVSSALATPIVGALSDRTVQGRRTGRFSGRRPARPSRPSVSGAGARWPGPATTGPARRYRTCSSRRSRPERPDDHEASDQMTTHGS